MQYKLFFETLTNIFPIDSALDDDKVGLQINLQKVSINKCLIAYELNESVVKEAINLQVDLIVAFHPLIYRPLQEIDIDERVAKLTSILIKNDISLYSLHTCFDNYKDGTNKIIADKFGLINRYWIIPDMKYKENGFGIVGYLENELEINDFIKLCEDVFLSPIRVNSTSKSNFVKKIAIIGGSGTSFIAQVEKLNVDAFITADVSYHNFHRAEGKYFLIDPGHFEMEQFVAKGIYDILNKNISGVSFSLSKVYTNPVRYSNPKYNDMQVKNLVN